MEDDNGAFAGVAFQGFEAAFGRSLGKVIAAENVPHHKRVPGLQRSGLLAGDSSIRRTEEWTLDAFCALHCIAQVGVGGGIPAVRMGMCVVSNGVALLAEIGEDLRMRFNVFSQAEKAGRRIERLENIKHFRRDLRNGPVVKGEVHLPLGCWDAPEKIAGQGLEHVWNGCEMHGVKVVLFGVRQPCRNTPTCNAVALLTRVVE